MAKFETLNSHTMFSKHKDWHSFDTAMLLDCSIMSFHKLFANGGALTFLITLSTCKEVGLPILVCFLKHDSAILAHEFGTHRAEAPPQQHKQVVKGFKLF
jgi:hypothetical protein